MLSIKQKVESDIKYIGKNYLDYKISELLDISVELAQGQNTTFQDAITVINRRITVYRKIIEERYT